MVKVVSGSANIDVGIWNLRIGISQTVFFIFSRKDAVPINRNAKFASLRLNFKNKIAKQEHNLLFSHFLFLRDIMPELELV
jgi:hypothetical protein